MSRNLVSKLSALGMLCVVGVSCRAEQEAARTRAPSEVPARDAPRQQASPEPEAAEAQPVEHGAEDPQADGAARVTPSAVRFPPRDVSPPHERSRQPGDGIWRPLGDASRGDRIASNEPLMVTTVIHPDPLPYVSLTVVAMDLERLRVHHVPGTEDVDKKTWPRGVTVGLVPESQRDGVVAVFNGGFQPRHGRWGMVFGEHTVLPPRDIGCTIALDRDGGVRIAPFAKIAGSEASLAALRQTPPCLVGDGIVHEDLVKGNLRVWAGRNPDITTRRRSAIGIDGSGTVLYYAVSMEASPLQLAEGMRLTGAVYAAQLDINWAWTQFLLFGTPPEKDELRVTSTLVPEMIHSRTGYVARPSERDFFYVTLRAAAR